MRAPSPTFKEEIKAFRSRLMAGPDDEWRRLLVGVLDRWEGHPDVERIWIRIKAEMPTAWAGEFIAAVLTRCKLVREIELRLPALAKTEDQVKSRAKRHINAGQFRAAATELDLWDNVKAASANVLGREKATGARKHFIVGWSTMFQQACGRPLDDVVAFLAEVAFDETVTAEAVRGLRKPSTRAGRKGNRDTETPK